MTKPANPATTQDIPTRPRFADLKLVHDAEPAPPIWSPPEPSSPGPTTSDVLHVPIGAIAQEIERELIATLIRPIAPGEGHAAGNAKREHELRALLGMLDVTQSFHVRRRLELARAGDPLCAAFQRITADRRGRLLQFLNDARRRALASGTRRSRT